MSATNKKAKRGSRRPVPQRERKRSGTKVLDDRDLAGVAGSAADASYEYLIGESQRLNVGDHQDQLQQLAGDLGKLRSGRGKRRISTLGL